MQSGKEYRTMAEPWMTAKEMKNYIKAMTANGIPAETVYVNLAKLNYCETEDIQRVLKAENAVM